MAKPRTLHCTICTRAIPEGRDRRQTATCSETCKNRLDEIRAQQRADRRCPACLHPSSPEERDEFRLWRAQRARNAPGEAGRSLDVRSPVREPRDGSTASRRALASGLRQALKALDDLVKLVSADEGENLNPSLEAATAKVHKLRKLLTSPPKQAIDSTPSGVTATENEHESLG